MEDNLFFANPYFPNPLVPESGGGVLITEQAGYVPADVLIKNMILSGQRLKEFRDSEFDVSFDSVHDDESDLLFNPSRRLDFDLSDASRIQNELNAKFFESRKEMENLKKTGIEDSENKVSEDIKNPKSALSNT